MGNRTENTAVNRLIEQAHSRPLEADDALFSSPPPKKTLPPPFRSRVPSSTQTHTAAAPPPAVKLPEDEDLPITVEEAMAPKPALRIATAPAPAPAPAPQPVKLHALKVDEAQWYEESLQSERLDEDELPEPGVRISRGGGRARTMLWLSAAFAAGLVATAIVAWPGKSVTSIPSEGAARVEGPRAPAPAPAVVAAPAAAPAVVAAPAAEPAVAEPAVAEPAVAAPASLVIESDPPGATVMLVDASGARPIGTTPMPYVPESSGSFELMLTLAGHRSTVLTVDPSASKRVSVELASTVEAVAVAEEREPAPAPRAKPAAKAAAPKTKPAPRVARVDAPRAAPAPARPTGGGVLALGAKPPCDIFIDGKKTGLKTPQRALKVSPGPHRITLVNREHRITETFSVDVKAGSPTKVVKDLTSRMK